MGQETPIYQQFCQPSQDLVRDNTLREQQLSAKDLPTIATLSTSVDYWFKDKHLAAPISALDTHCDNSLNEKMVQHIHARSSRYESAWLKEVEQFCQWREFVSKLKSEPLDPDTKTLLDGAVKRISWQKYKGLKQQVLALDLNDVLRYHIYQCEKNNFKTLNNTRDRSINYQWIRVGGLTESFPRIKEYTHSRNNLLIPLLAEFYLPSNILQAIKSLLQLWYGWDSQAILNMRKSDIQINRKDSKITIRNLDGDRKTQSDKVVIDSNQQFERARIIELLLEHHQNIEKYNRPLNPPTLMYGFVRKDPGFAQLSLKGNSAKLCIKHQLPNHSDQQIRNQFIAGQMIENGKIDRLSQFFGLV